MEIKAKPLSKNFKCLSAILQLIALEHSLSVQKQTTAILSFEI